MKYFFSLFFLFCSHLWGGGQFHIWANFEDQPSVKNLQSNPEEKTEKTTLTVSQERPQTEFSEGPEEKTKPAKQITCKTPQESHRFIIRKAAIRVETGMGNQNSKRRLSSLIPVRTSFKGKGLTKFMYLGKEKFTIHIHDQNHFSETDDYLMIRFRNGHEITYPLNCQ